MPRWPNLDDSYSPISWGSGIWNGWQIPSSRPRSCPKHCGPGWPTKESCCTKYNRWFYILNLSLGGEDVSALNADNTAEAAHITTLFIYNSTDRQDKETSGRMIFQITVCTICPDPQTSRPANIKYVPSETRWKDGGLPTNFYSNRSGNFLHVRHITYTTYAYLLWNTCSNSYISGRHPSYIYKFKRQSQIIMTLIFKSFSC